MKTWEMIQKLCENKQRKAYSDEYDLIKHEDGDEHARSYCAYISQHGSLSIIVRRRHNNTFQNGTYKTNLTQQVLERTWTIVEPEIKKVKFLDALLAHNQSKYIFSLETQRTIHQTDDISNIEFTESEINGLWEIHK